MNLVIAGGGNVGYYLCQALCERRYHVCVIEQNLNRCEWIERTHAGHNLVVVHGDAAKEQILLDAGVARCDTFIAVTGQDQNNLTACMMAKQLLHAKRTITRVNNPKNIRVFQRLGVDSVISSVSRITDMIEQELDWADVDAILSEKTDNARIRQFLVDGRSKAASRPISRLRLPAETIIVVVVRGNRAFIPNGTFRLEADDELIMMGSEEHLAAAEPLFYQEVTV